MTVMRRFGNPEAEPICRKRNKGSRNVCILSLSAERNAGRGNLQLAVALQKCFVLRGIRVGNGLSLLERDDLNAGGGTRGLFGDERGTDGDGAVVVGHDHQVKRMLFLFHADVDNGRRVGIGAGQLAPRRLGLIDRNGEADALAVCKNTDHIFVLGNSLQT